MRYLSVDDDDFPLVPFAEIKSSLRMQSECKFYSQKTAYHRPRSIYREGAYLERWSSPCLLPAGFRIGNGHGNSDGDGVARHHWMGRVRCLRHCGNQNRPWQSRRHGLIAESMSAPVPGIRIGNRSNGNGNSDSAVVDMAGGGAWRGGHAGGGHNDDRHGDGGLTRHCDCVAWHGMAMAVAMAGTELCRPRYDS
jgi:hypothetical protein